MPLCESGPDFRKCPNPTLKLNALSDPTCVSAQGFWWSAALRLQLLQDLSLDECIQTFSRLGGRLADILPINPQPVGPRCYEAHGRPFHN
ncbi:hypothetical protein MRS44_009290 [Fusarium solani]|uniref:uncharacterized protein n=1 Tax=Fusarium solani TaxID=169388 RepID=UPI0032C4178D|nr:hypothetical protein MRS44_009290 [Fusarium solani]